MKEYHWTLEDALKYVKSQRGVVHPNEGFMKQLQEYEGILCARSVMYLCSLLHSNKSLLFVLADFIRGVVIEEVGDLPGTPISGITITQLQFIPGSMALQYVYMYIENTSLATMLSL